MFLSKDDLKTLTGYTHKAKQITHLASLGIPFALDGKGKPVVAISEISSVLSKKTVKSRNKSSGPNWEALRGQKKEGGQAPTAESV
jgi:hypothetical protein